MKIVFKTFWVVLLILGYPVYGHVLSCTSNYQNQTLRIDDTLSFRFHFGGDRAFDEDMDVSQENHGYLVRLSHSPRQKDGEVLLEVTGLNSNPPITIMKKTFHVKDADEDGVLIDEQTVLEFKNWLVKKSFSVKCLYLNEVHSPEETSLSIVQSSGKPLDLRDLAIIKKRLHLNVDSTSNSLSQLAEWLSSYKFKGRRAILRPLLFALGASALHGGFDLVLPEGNPVSLISRCR